MAEPVSTSISTPPPAGPAPTEPPPPPPPPPPASSESPPVPLPSASTDPAIPMAMTTLIENGQTMVLPVQQTGTGFEAQTGLANGWAGLGATTTTTSAETAGTTSTLSLDPGVPGTTGTADNILAPEATRISESTVPPVDTLTTSTPPVPPGTASDAPAMTPAVLPDGEVIIPSGAMTTATTAPLPAPSLPPGEVAGVTPGVLKDNDKPIISNSGVSGTTTSPPVNTAPAGVSTSVSTGPSLSIPPKPTPSATTAPPPPLSLIAGLPNQNEKSSLRVPPPSKPTTTSRPTSQVLDTNNTTTVPARPTSDLSLIPGLSTSTSSRTTWDLVGTSTSSGADKPATESSQAATTASATKALKTSGMLPQGNLVLADQDEGASGNLALGTPTGTDIPSTAATQTSAGSTGTPPPILPHVPANSPGSTSNPNDKPKPKPTLPPPGSPEESNVRALISSTVTLSGTVAVSAIREGATQLESVGGTSLSSKAEKGGWNGFVIAGIVAGGVLGVVLGIVVWAKWRKRSKTKEDDIQSEKASRPGSGFDFTDDPITARTAHFRRKSLVPQGPFDDHYQSQYDVRESWYQPTHPDHPNHPNATHTQGGHEEDDGYPYFKNVNLTPDPDPQTFQPRSDGYYSHGGNPDDLEMLYGDSMEREQARRELNNPFEPPVPPLPAGMRQSSFSTRSGEQRPSTGMSDIYGSFEAPTRPTTQVDRDDTGDEEDDDRDLPMKTPATSSLLPWLSKNTPAPPVPALPNSSGGRSARSAERERRAVDVPENVEEEEYEDPEPDTAKYTAYPSNAAGVGAARAGQVQRPARPVMAQTPAGAGGNGFNTMIPGFR